MPPGSLVYTGEKVGQQYVHVSYTRLQNGVVTFVKDAKLEDCFPLADDAMHWINIDGLHVPHFIEQLGKFIDIHPLVLEDILTIGQRPKIEEHQNYLFFVLHVLNYNKQTQHIEEEQASFILGSNFLISLLEKDYEFFKPITERLLQGRNKAQRLGMDYLAYNLIDTIVDRYFLVLDGIGDRIISLEDHLLKNPDNKTLKEISKLKHEMIILRRTIWPLREAISNLKRLDNQLIDDETMPYFLDIYDHTVQLMDTVESFREIIGGMVYIHMSSTTHHMNDIIKILTIVSTIFVPLTFITGVYGMNFDFMPELHNRWGYLTVWGIMLSIGLFMVYFFWRKRWFS